MKPRLQMLLCVMMSAGWLTVACIGLVAHVCSQRTVARQTAIPGVEINPSGLIAVYCSGCHTSGRAKVDLGRDVEFHQLGRDRDTWQRAVDQLRNQAMPPAKQPQPTAAERQLLIAWIEQALAEAEVADRGRLAARRLRRSEYMGTIRDLLGVELPADIDLPSDYGNGWDRGAAVRPLPPVQQEQYLAAARKALDEAVIAPFAVSLSRRDAKAAARAYLAGFAQRAYRRPVDSAEIGRLLAVFECAAGDGQQLDTGIRAALEAILSAPQFLHHVEILPDADDPNAPAVIDPFALASRLSYWLWNSMPDDELRSHAEHGTLSANLKEQAIRLLHDPRAGALSRNFAGFWLELDKTPQFVGVDPELDRAMRQETELFIGHVVQANRSVLEFLDADYTFANQGLANHYGLPKIDNQGFQRVSLTGSQRGGLLTHASLLSLNTSAVKRGKWIMDNLLGTPPPAPPAGLLDAFQNTRTAFDPGTGRQLLEQHRAHASCAHCHAQMDALGLALEHFDWRGAWRDQEGALPIDAAVVLPSGEPLSGPGDVRAYLLKNRDMFLRCLSGKLLSHALGRKLTPSDWAGLDGIAKRMPESDYRFHPLLLEVVSSAAFEKACR